MWVSGCNVDVPIDYEFLSTYWILRKKNTCRVLPTRDVAREVSSHPQGQKCLQKGQKQLFFLQRISTSQYPLLMENHIYIS